MTLTWNPKLCEECGKNPAATVCQKCAGWHFRFYYWTEDSDLIVALWRMSGREG